MIGSTNLRQCMCVVCMCAICMLFVLHLEFCVCYVGDKKNTNKTIGLTRTH